MIQPNLETERLLLTAPRESDIDTMAELCQDPTIQDMVLPIGKNYTREKAEFFIREVIPKIWASGYGVEFAIRLRAAEEEMIGMVGLSFPAGEVGLWLGPRFRGQGIAQEALTALIDWTQTSTQAPNQYRWTSLPENAASKRLAKRMGFGYTGTTTWQMQDGTNVLLQIGTLGTDGAWPDSGLE